MVKDKEVKGERGGSRKQFSKNLTRLLLNIINIINNIFRQYN